MANVLRSDFLGASLKRTEVSQTKAAERVQTQAIFGKKAAKKAEKTATKVQKSATKVAKQATKQVKKAASGKKTKGWFGGVGGAQDLDKWYGESDDLAPDNCADRSLRMKQYLIALMANAGPSRALYLPSGLLDPADVPSYLNGTLPGE